VAPMLGLACALTCCEEILNLGVLGWKGVLQLLDLEGKARVVADQW
jgi:hypothetical protein